MGADGSGGGRQERSRQRTDSETPERQRFSKRAHPETTADGSIDHMSDRNFVGINDFSASESGHGGVLENEKANRIKFAAFPADAGQSCACFGDRMLWGQHALGTEHETDSGAAVPARISGAEIERVPRELKVGLLASKW